MQRQENGQKGFTLVELMVVVTIISILAAVGIPRVFSYIRTSATAEVAQDAGSISSGLAGYAQSRLQTAAATQTAVNSKTATPDLSTATEISTLVPQIQLPKGGKFDYAISAIVATAGPDTGEVVYCITATGRSNAAVAGGKVLYSSASTTAAGWDGRVNRTAFVNGATELTGVTAGGYCSATGAAQATHT